MYPTYLGQTISSRKNADTMLPIPSGISSPSPTYSKRGRAKTRGFKWYKKKLRNCFLNTSGSSCLILIVIFILVAAGSLWSAQKLGSSYVSNWLQSDSSVRVLGAISKKLEPLRSPDLLREKSSGTLQQTEKRKVEEIIKEPVSPLNVSNQFVVKQEEPKEHIYVSYSEKFVDLSKYYSKLSIPIKNQLEWEYLSSDKKRPYVGHKQLLSKLTEGSRRYMNSLAVFTGYDESHMHGKLGITEDGHQIWTPAARPPPIDEYPGGKDAALKNGGFFLPLANSIPLDRNLGMDSREDFCINIKYNVTDLPDASIMITFFDEPISVLLRTVHSILNTSPPPLVREILLVDDHSTLDEDHEQLAEYVKYLPKVKLMRLGERRGIVHARVAAAKAARGEVLVTLDSHIEMNAGWLEPQLQRIKDSPNSIVFPQILSLNAETMEPQLYSGIGCWLTFRWAAVEQASISHQFKSPDPIPSPSMAGGLFAVRRDWFWELGGYDEGFVAWGAENVEMGFRTWMCGGKVECVPCARSYHIFRKGGVGYKNPTGALWRNKMRTARIWMDEYFQLASPIINRSANPPVGPQDFGNIDHMLELKERLQCKPFKWYLKNVAKNHDVQSLDDILGFGRLRNDLTVGQTNHSICLDLMGHRIVGGEVGIFPCHRQNKIGSNQMFLVSKDDLRIRLAVNDKRCIVTGNSTLQIGQCGSQDKGHWRIKEIKKSTFVFESIADTQRKGRAMCLTHVPQDKNNARAITIDLCHPDSAVQMWIMDPFIKDENFSLPTFSDSYLSNKNLWRNKNHDFHHQETK